MYVDSRQSLQQPPLACRGLAFGLYSELEWGSRTTLAAYLTYDCVLATVSALFLIAALGATVHHQRLIEHYKNPGSSARAVPKEQQKQSLRRVDVWAKVFIFFWPLTLGILAGHEIQTVTRLLPAVEPVTVFGVVLYLFWQLIAFKPFGEPISLSNGVRISIISFLGGLVSALIVHIATDPASRDTFKIWMEKILNKVGNLS